MPTTMLRSNPPSVFITFPAIQPTRAPMIRVPNSRNINKNPFFSPSPGGPCLSRENRLNP